MKRFVLTLAVVAVLAMVVSADHHHHADEYVVRTMAALTKYRSECATKLGVPAELAEKYSKWNYPDDELTHCYIKCIFEKFNFFDEVHGFDVEKVHQQLAGVDTTANHDDEIHQKIEQCADKNTQASDVCTWAYRAGMCFIKNNLHLIMKSVESH